jgi:NADH-quinone oxidoreductase subunit L
MAIGDLLYSGYFTGSIAVNAQAHPAMAELAHEFDGAAAMTIEGLTSLPFGLAVAGVALAWYMYLLRPELPGRIQHRFQALHRLLVNKYYMDRINEVVFARGARAIGTGLWQGGDVALIDGVAVNGSARLVTSIALLVRRVQSGFIYHYAFAMLLGLMIVLFAFLTWPYVIGAAR